MGLSRSDLYSVFVGLVVEVFSRGRSRSVTSDPTRPMDIGLRPAAVRDYRVLSRDAPRW